MIDISDQFIIENIHYPALIDALKKGFSSGTIECPPKLSYDYSSAEATSPNTCLIMPAWDNSSVFGVKLITATPDNANKSKPYLNGLYALFDAITGLPLASMDAKLMTNMRTAATSVLGSMLLAKKTSSSVLILGNGSLSPYYIAAYASMPFIKNIYVWGRNFKKTEAVIEGLQLDKTIHITAIKDYASIAPTVDIISCITSTKKELIDIEHTSKGQHFDLAGSYKDDMQEVSTDVVAASSVFVDNFEITTTQAGEIVNAVNEGKIQLSDIKGDLKMLCASEDEKRISETENTLLKCTGMALEDLVFAQLAYEKYKQQKQ